MKSSGFNCQFLMTTLDNIRESLLKIDQFGVPLTLRIGNKNIFNTQMGAFMTMFLTFVLIKSGYSLRESSSNRKSAIYDVAWGILECKQGKNFPVNHKEFELAFILFDADENIIAPDVYTATFNFIYYEGYNISSEADIDFIPCNSVPNQEELINKTVGLIKDIFTRGMCLNKSQWKAQEKITFFQGGFADFNLSAMYFDIKECKNESAGCASANSRKILDGSQISLTYTDVSVDQQNVEEPFSWNQILKMIYLSRSATQKSRIFLTKTFFLDLINPFYFFSQLIQYESFKQTTSDSYSVTNQDSLLSYGWYIDNVMTTYQRTYPTILDVLGNLGGLYSMLFYISGALIKPIAQTQCNLKLINDIFHFPDMKAVNRSQILDEKTQPDQINLKFNQSRNLKEVRKMTNKTYRGLGTSLWVTFKYFFCGNDLYGKAQIKVDKYLDFLNLVKNYYTLKQLKKILLNQDQILLFKLIQKPAIGPEKLQQNQKADIEQIYKSYKNLSAHDSPANRLLLQNIDGTVSKYMEQFENNPQVSSNNLEPLGSSSNNLIRLRKADTDLEEFNI